MNKNIAEKTSILALQISGKLTNQLCDIENECSEDEFKLFRNRIARVLAEILTEIMNPIYNEHPDLKPKELGGNYIIDPEIYK